jgi:hypothetical protein
LITTYNAVLPAARYIIVWGPEAKRSAKSSFDDEQGTANFLFRIYRRFKQTMIESNIWGAFQEAGFYFDVSIEPYRVRFDEEKRRRTAVLQEILALDFALGNRTPRGQAAKFGWISKPEST